MGAQRRGRCSVGQRWPGAQVVVSGMLTVLVFAVLPVSAGAAAPVREWPAGALDPSFASGGVLTASFANLPSRQEGRDAAIQTDGKIIVLTTVAPPARYASYLSRHLPNGEPDTTFGNSGTVALPSSSGGTTLTPIYAALSAWQPSLGKPAARKPKARKRGGTTDFRPVTAPVHFAGIAVQVQTMR